MRIKPIHPILLDGASLTLERAAAVAAGSEVIMPPSVKKRIEAAQALVRKKSKEAQPIYGLNTGFGSLANRHISHKQLETLQINLVKSHAAGYGPPLSIPETRLAMALRLNVLVKGFTGVSYELCQALFSMIQANIYPIIPEYGSVGASGDLAPLAHLALPLTGNGLVQYEGQIISAAEALKKAGLKPIRLKEKEGLGLINGTQIMLAVGGLALFDARNLLDKADKIAALTYEAMAGSIDALNPMIHELRGQRGQIESARAIREELIESYLHSPKVARKNVQDPYSIRCAPQIHGPARDTIKFSEGIVENELNAVTDNPIVFAEQGKILSGGNFHGESLAFAFDFAAIAISEIANVSDRRLETLLNPGLSGLPAFLTPKEGLNSGYMALQYLTASLVNENKIQANPASTDSIPGNAGIEDHVSMGMTSARKLKRIVENTRAVLAAEMVAAAQAIDLRNSQPLGKGTRKTYEAVRNSITMLTNDRIPAEDINKAVEVLDLL